MKDGPAFQLYAADFYMDTGGWTPTQVGIYFRLLMSEWVNGSIPNDMEQLSRIAQIDGGNFLKCYRPTIEGKFVPNGDGNLINKRLEEVREKQRKYRESQSQKGKYSAQIRWDKKITGVITEAQPTTQPNCNSSSSSSLSNKQYICEVFKFWQKTMNHPRALLDKKREKKIESQLKAGRTMEECKKAIEGCKNSTWHMGSNDRQKIFDSIDLIFRDAEHFESFLSQQPKKIW